MVQTIEEILKECHEAQLPYESWFNELSIKQQEEIQKQISRITQLSEREYRQLGFMAWDEEFHLMLIPAWLVHLLPDGIEVTTIQGEKLIKGEHILYSDVFQGCTAYGFEKKIEKKVSMEKDGDIVKKVQIEEKRSEEIGEYVSVFHCRLEKELEVGIDHSTGEPCKAYCQVKLEHTNPISPESYQKIHEEEYRYVLAKKGGCDPKYITPITKEEYERETAE